MDYYGHFATTPYILLLPLPSRLLIVGWYWEIRRVLFKRLRVHNIREYDCNANTDGYK
jgi:hypothetical protein